MEGASEVTGGTSSSVAAKINTKEWLQKNKLSDIEKIFTERDVSIEELTEFTNDDLKEFAKELGLDILARKRFVKGIIAVRSEMVQNNIPSGISSMSAFASHGSSVLSNVNSVNSVNSNSKGLLSNTVVSKAEHEAISRLYVRFDETSRLMQDIHNSFQMLNASKTECVKKVEIDFNSIFKGLDIKKGELLESVENLKNTKFEILTKQLETLKTHLKLIVDAKSKYESYVCDRSLDSQSRKRIVLRMTNEILNDANVVLLMATQPKMLFSHLKMKQSLSLFGNSLKIDDCDQPRAFEVKISKFKFNYIEIELKMDNESLKIAQLKPILDISIEWARLPKEQESMLKKESSKSSHKSKDSSSKKKKKRKNKRKKHKKKQKSSTFDSSSESGSDEESSSSNDDNESGSDSDSDSDSDKENVKGIILKNIDSSQIDKIIDSIDEDTIKWEATVEVNRNIISMAQSNNEIEIAAAAAAGGSGSGDVATEATATSGDVNDENNENKESKMNENSDNSSSDSDSDSDSESGSQKNQHYQRNLFKKSIEKFDARRLRRVNRNNNKNNNNNDNNNNKEDKEDEELNKPIKASKLKRFCKKGRLTYKIQGLKPNKGYLIRVCGRNESGWGLYSSPLVLGVTKKLIIDSKVLNSKEKLQLIKFIPNGKKSKWKLIYRASVNGFSGSTFHAMCNGKAPTVVVVHTTLNYVFGGYTSMAWTSNGSYAYDNKALIFLLRSQRKDKPQKWEVQNVSYSVNHNGSYGPTFGGGHDFYLANGCNTNSSSYSNLGHSYSAPKDKSLLAGGYNFMVKEYEVFELK